jgi:diguanylate cyclase (GGDEF)-like protein
MHALALTDELTGLPNRRAALARLADTLQARRKCAVLIVDLDHFKSINDRHGHLIGDEVLRVVATVLKDVVREPMSAGRLGGEEFLLLLPDTDLEAALHVAERLRAAVASMDTSRWSSGSALSISIGVTITNPNIVSVADALRGADEALFAAKAAGRNRVHASTLALVA